MPTAGDHLAPFSALPFNSVEQITGNENLMVLVAHPGDESLACGGLIAHSCSRGRPPFVMVLGDGSASHPRSVAWPPDRLAGLHERETRKALGCLGLDDERLLMIGLFDGTIPQTGVVFEAVVRAVIQVMWRMDCNVVCAPWPQSCDPAHRSTHAIARAVASRSGVGHLSYVAGSWGASGTTAVAVPSEGWRFDTTGQQSVKRDAVAAHATLCGRVVEDDPEPSVPNPALLAACIQSAEIFLKPL